MNVMPARKQRMFHKAIRSGGGVDSVGKNQVPEPNEKNSGIEI